VTRNRSTRAAQDPTLTNDGTGTTTVSRGNGGSIHESHTLALTDHASASDLHTA
jgi:hypothetical protein